MDINKQLEVIKRGVVEIISEPELKKKIQESLAQNRPLRIKAGFDPTAPDLHLGHTVLLRKLRQFQDLGHHVIFLIGDFTGRIGDPTGRSELRRQLTKEEVLKNAQTYKKQISKVLDLKRLQIVFNSEWFDKMPMLEFLELTKLATVSQMLAREDFKKRLSRNENISLLEFMYPLLQGFDSVKLKADIELGGSDQIFNLLVGRDIQRDFGQAEQVVITMPLLEGTDGKQKMSKSYGNYVGINEPADEIFGKLMSISDELMFKYYELLTDLDLEEVRAKHPKQAKEELAWRIVSDYHGENSADSARKNFDNVFKNKELPESINECVIGEDKKIIDILTASGLVKSKNEVRRLIQQGGIIFDDQKVSIEDFLITKSGIAKIGPRRFLKIIRK
ncbi:MAG: tyrosine--tRNA ligase [Candidatus Omnitrophica bacterium]|nr:tyrosine--tRNA ligase [Candidatus Omnitrophota bacterium]